LIDQQQQPVSITPTIKKRTPIDLHIRSGLMGVDKFKTRITYTDDQSFEDAFELLRVKIKVGNKLAVAFLIRGCARESSVLPNARISDICDGLDVEKVIYWTFSAEEEEEEEI
jgi:hypothetical protein